MKLRTLSMFTITVGLALVLALAAAAQGAEGINTTAAAPTIAHADASNESVAFHAATSLSVGHSSRTTSAVVPTVYLPLVARNYGSLRLYFDDFSNPNSGWSTAEDEGLKVGYLGGEYQILLKKTTSGELVTPDLTLPANYRIEVDARQASSNPGSYGLMFGIQGSGNAYEGYQVIVYPADPIAGLYLLEKRNTDGSWPVLIDWTYSAAIGQGMATNHLRVDRIGTAIDIYINGALVDTFTDTSFIGSGRDAGVRAYSYDSAPVDVRFDNFAVYRIP